MSEVTTTEPVDALALVRQYGAKKVEALSVGECGGDDEPYEREADVLFARIEAEVKTLRQAALASEVLVGVLTDERDEARAGLAQATGLVKTLRLARSIAETARKHVEAERDEARAQVETQAGNFLAATNTLVAERELLRRERDELDDRAANALAEVERLLEINRSKQGRIAELQAEAAAPDRTEQAQRRGEPLWQHACGTVWPVLHQPAGLEHACCSEPGPWRPLLVATAPDPAAPLVLRLPQMPEGAVALVGEVTGHRWVPSEFGRWVDEQTGQVRDFAEVLTREHAVTVEMAPPCEPRFYPQINEEYGDPPAVVDTEIGRWRRRADGKYESADPDLITLPFTALLAIGDVTEVFDA